jgi:hypothetical protein
MSNEPGKPPWSRSDIEAKILRAVSDVMAEPVAAPITNAPESPRAETPAPRIILTNWTVAKAYTGVPDKEHPVVEGVFMKGTAAILAGIGGAGKTDIDIDLGLKIAMNDGGDQTWLGYSVAASGSVVILTAEDNKGAVHQRIDKLQPMFSMSSNTEKLIVVPIPNVDGLGSPALFDQKARPTDLFRQIEDQIHDIGDVQLFVPDPLRAFCRADINSDPDAATVVRHAPGHAGTAQPPLAEGGHPSAERHRSSRGHPGRGRHRRSLAGYLLPVDAPTT